MDSPELYPFVQYEIKTFCQTSSLKYHYALSYLSFTELQQNVERARSEGMSSVLKYG